MHEEKKNLTQSSAIFFWQLNNYILGANVACEKKNSNTLMEIVSIFFLFTPSHICRIVIECMFSSQKQQQKQTYFRMRNNEWRIKKWPIILENWSFGIFSPFFSSPPTIEFGCWFFFLLDFVLAHFVIFDWNGFYLSCHSYDYFNYFRFADYDVSIVNCFLYVCICPVQSSVF